MGKCISCPKKNQAKKVTLSVFGLDNAGKTSVVKILQGGLQNDVAPTVGFSTNSFKWKHIPVTLLDVGGGARIRDIWKNYFAESHGFVYVIDASDRERVNETSEVFSKLLNDQRIQGKPVLLLLNKQDVVGAISDTQATEQMQLEPLVNANKCPCRVEAISTVRKTKKRMDANLSDGFTWLIQYISNHYHELSDKVNRDLDEQRQQLAKEREERTERIRLVKEERKARGEDDESDGDQKTPTDLDDKGASDPRVRKLPQAQNGHAQTVAFQAPNAVVEEPNQSPPLSNGNVQLPPLIKNRRRVRPSSAGQQSATLSSSYQISVVPHLPPIASPPYLRRPPPQLPTSTTIPPPSPPPSAEIDSTAQNYEPTPQRSLSPQLRTVAEIGVSTEDLVAENREDDGRKKNHETRRRRKKRRLQKLNRTAPAPEMELKKLPVKNEQGEKDPEPTAESEEIRIENQEEKQSDKN